MRIIIRHIPVSMSCRQLETLVKSRLRRNWYWPFGDKPVIYSCQIVKASNPQGNGSEVFGLVTIRPRNAAVWVIERLNKVVLNNTRIEAREFFDRTFHRDRRKNLPSYSKNRRGDERRQGDRRLLTVIEVICASGSSSMGSAYITTASLF